MILFNAAKLSPVAFFSLMKLDLTIEICASRPKTSLISVFAPFLSLVFSLYRLCVILKLVKVILNCVI